MNKRALLDKFAEGIAADLAVLTQAAIHTREGAIHAESKAEDQYDTRGLEASYLAGAQSKRALELESELAVFRHVDIKVFTPTSRIASTAVVELEGETGKTYCLLMPKAGGRTMQFEGKTIQCITPQSPLGEALLGTSVGDEITVELRGTQKDYAITAVW